ARDQPHVQRQLGDDDFDGAASVHAGTDDDAFAPVQPSEDVEEGSAGDLADGCQDQNINYQQRSFDDDAEGNAEAGDHKEDGREETDGEVPHEDGDVVRESATQNAFAD